MCLRQVLRGQFGSVHPRIDLLFDFIEAAPQRAWERRGCRQDEAEAGTQNPGIGAGVKERNPKSVSR
jgi:hypothetical protein